MGLSIPKWEEELSPWGTYQSLRASLIWLLPPPAYSNFTASGRGASLPAAATAADRSLSHFFSSRLLNPSLVPALGLDKRVASPQDFDCDKDQENVTTEVLFNNLSFSDISF